MDSNGIVYVQPDMEFIAHVERTAAQVKKWPEWKKGWIGCSSPDWTKKDSDQVLGER